MPAAAAPHDSAYSWFRLAISLAIGTLAGVGMWSVVLVLPPVQAEFGVGRGDASLPYVATMVGYGLGNLLLGRAVDRAGITAVVIVAALGLAGGYLVAASASSLWVFAAAKVLIGTGAGAGFAPLMADISHWFRRRRGIAVAIVASGNYAAGALWPLALRPWLETGDWRGAYLFIAVACLVGIVPLALCLRRRLPVAMMAAGAGPQAGPVREIAVSQRLLPWLLALAGIGCCVAMAMPQVHIVAYCVDLGHGAAAGAEMVSLMLAAGVASRIISGLVMDRIGGVLTLLIGSGLQGMALALYIPFDGLHALYVVSFVFGLSQGGIVPSYAMIVREYLPAEKAGSWIGFVISATIVGMALGGWLSGFIFDLTGSYELAFLNGIAWNALNVGIVLMLLWRTRTPRAAPA
jgi:MFS family permease